MYTHIPLTSTRSREADTGTDPPFVAPLRFESRLGKSEKSSFDVCDICVCVLRFLFWVNAVKSVGNRPSLRGCRCETVYGGRGVESIM